MTTDDASPGEDDVVLFSNHFIHAEIVGNQNIFEPGKRALSLFPVAAVLPIFQSHLSMGLVGRYSHKLWILKRGETVRCYAEMFAVSPVF